MVAIHTSKHIAAFQIVQALHEDRLMSRGLRKQVC